MQATVDEINTIVDEVRALMNSKRPVHPEQFTGAALKLAVLKRNLGHFKSEVKRKQLVAEKTQMAKAKLDGLAITAAKEFVRQETADERVMYEAVETEHNDIRQIIEMIRSHASAIKEDM